MVLKTYTGEHTPVAGQMEVKVKYGSQRQMLRLVVVACHGTLLQGMHHVQCYIDDILITKEECIENVEEVLKHLQHHGIHLKCNKCAFLQESVECPTDPHLMPQQILLLATCSLQGIYGPD